MATLGEGEDSIEHDRSTVSKSARRHQPRVGSKFTVHEIVNGNNTIREYVSRRGTIFAVAWNGFSHPDLTSLLGNYWREYSDEQNAAPKKHDRGQREIKTSNIVVEKGGHMRALFGKAYIPELLPRGMSADEIK